MLSSNCTASLMVYSTCLGNQNIFGRKKNDRTQTLKGGWLGERIKIHPHLRGGATTEKIGWENNSVVWSERFLHCKTNFPE